MAKSLVSVIPCPDYQPENLKNSILQALEKALIFDRFDLSGKKILLKPNLLKDSTPDQAICTHPEFVRQLALILQEKKASVTVGESAGGSAIGKTARAYTACGLANALEESGIPFLNFDSCRAETVTLNGKHLKNIPLTACIRDFDLIVSVPKVKTHVETRMTGAVKNMMGMIPGSGKLAVHRMAPQADLLGEAVTELLYGVKPDFCVTDGILSMEGDGPNQGDPLHTGLILCSSDIVACDSIQSRIMGFSEREVSYLWYAQKLGFGNADWSEVEVCGSFQKLPVFSFKKGGVSLTRCIPSFILKLLSGVIRIDPQIDSEMCRKCMICAQTCPVGAISDNLIIDYKKCIRCLCCHELCPHHALKLKKSLLMRIITGK